MIRNVIMILMGALFLAAVGAVWGLIAASSLANSSDWPVIAALGAAAALSFLGLPWMFCFLYAYTRKRGRHASVIMRSPSRYIRPRYWEYTTKSGKTTYRAKLAQR